MTWTGGVRRRPAQGVGTITWVWDGNEQVSTGWLQDGKTTGHWVIHQRDGTVAEGSMVDGDQNGHWVLRFANGRVEEGPFVDSERSGDWVVRDADGDVTVRRLVNGQFVEIVEQR